MIGTSETPLYKGFNIVRDQEDVIVVTIKSVPYLLYMMSKC